MKKGAKGKAKCSKDTETNISDNDVIAIQITEIFTPFAFRAN